jgi:hypothetical protein
MRRTASAAFTTFPFSDDRKYGNAGCCDISASPGSIMVGEHLQVGEHGPVRRGRYGACPLLGLELLCGLRDFFHRPSFLRRRLRGCGLA